jgi:hypothetical protein
LPGETPPAGPRALSWLGRGERSAVATWCSVRLVIADGQVRELYSLRKCGVLAVGGSIPSPV